MKKTTFSILFILFSLFLFSQDLKPLDQGSTIDFKLKNFGLNTGGSFSGLQGIIHFDESNLSTASFDVSLDASSVNTGNDSRDNHLRDEDYFDVKKYPRIHFVSTTIKAGAKQNAFILSGKLTIKDITQEISFPFLAKPSNEGYIFAGEFK